MTMFLIQDPWPKNAVFLNNNNVAKTAVQKLNQSCMK